MSKNAAQELTPRRGVDRVIISDDFRAEMLKTAVNHPPILVERVASLDSEDLLGAVVLSRPADEQQQAKDVP